MAITIHIDFVLCKFHRNRDAYLAHAINSYYLVAIRPIASHPFISTNNRISHFQHSFISMVNMIQWSETCIELYDNPVISVLKNVSTLYGISWKQNHEKMETFASELDVAARFKLKQSANIATFMRLL